MKFKKIRKIALKNVDWRSYAIPVVGLACLVISFAIGIMIILPEESIYFNFTENPGMWQLSEGSKFSRVGDSIRLIKGKGPLYLVVPQMNVDADYYDVCVIEGSWPIAYEQGRLLFISQFNKQYDYYNFGYDFDAGTAGKMNRRYIDLKKHAAWRGIIKEVLLLPANKTKQVSIKGIRFIHANPLTKIRAWWSDFIRYSDPLLGTCFAMATPIFIGKPFNPFFVPVFWFFLGMCGIIVAGVHWLKADSRISKTTAGVCFVIVIIAWGVLDLRNNVVYLKAISRNISLYWGKSMQEKRGIVVGDQEFIDFMKFCDENIPLDARIFNQVPNELPGTPANYLSPVQYAANLRPRFYNKLSSSYFIFYNSQRKGNWEVCQEQSLVDKYIDIIAGEKLVQEVQLWQPSKFLSQINIWIQEKDIGKAKIVLSLLSKDRKTVSGKAEYVSQAGNEAVFRFLPGTNSNKNENMLLQVENKGNTSVGIGIIYGEQYREGCLIQAGKKLYGDLAFRFIYRPKIMALFKRFNDDAYILIDQEI